MKNIGKDNDSGYFLNVKNTYIGNDLLLTKRSIMNEFLTEIGINNANTDKRERLNSDEVNANNSEVRCTIVRYIDSLNECAKRINENPNFDDITNLHFSINSRVITTLQKKWRVILMFSFASICQLYTYDEVFKDIDINDKLDKDTLINAIMDVCGMNEPIYPEIEILQIKVQYFLKNTRISLIS